MGDRVVAGQASKAFGALRSFHLSSKGRELGETTATVLNGDVSDKTLVVFLQVGLKPFKGKRRERAVSIPHALVKESICLLTPDPQRWWKDALVERGVRGVDRVVGVANFGSKFKTGDARRKLMQDHDRFLCDDRLLPILPKILGPKWWSQGAKRPAGVDVRDPANMKAHLEQAISCTTVTLPVGGGTASIRLGHLRRHTPDDLVDNLAAVLGQIETLMPGGLDNVLSLDVKLAMSAALPLWRAGSTEDAEDVQSGQKRKAEVGMGRGKTDKKTRASK